MALTKTLEAGPLAGWSAWRFLVLMRALSEDSVEDAVTRLEIKRESDTKGST
jgi:hypothetical protein